MDHGQPRPKRILALDGGGLRAVVSIAFLQRLERKLAIQYGRPVGLHEHFDLIGGTSTGALLAAGLALGMSPAELLVHYRNLGPAVSRRGWGRIPVLGARFGAARLERYLEGLAGNRTMDSPSLLTGLAVVTKRLDTGGVCYLTNNPAAPSWDDAEDGSRIGRRRHLLANVVRASAAPRSFGPRRIRVAAGQGPGLFVDGGVSADNNPSLALFQVATGPAYGYGWPTGARQLEITSIGTGASRLRSNPDGLAARLSLFSTTDALRSVSGDAEMRVLAMMQMLGRSETPWPLDAGSGGLVHVPAVPEPLFTFRRYDMPLERDWLSRELGVALGERELRALRDPAGGGPMQRLYELAATAAERQL